MASRLGKPFFCSVKAVPTRDARIKAFYLTVFRPKTLLYPALLPANGIRRWRWEQGEPVLTALPDGAMPDCSG